MSPSPANSSHLAAAGEPSAHIERDVEQVPFVELAEGRLQGVVSSGSDIERVYCAYVNAGDLGFHSSTNNNRPDAGTAKRIRWLVEAACAQFGPQRVARYLQIDADPAKPVDADHVFQAIIRKGKPTGQPSGQIFSRFLDYLRYVERACPAAPVPEMAWFVEE
jgi:hypothetical protein